MGRLRKGHGEMLVDTDAVISVSVEDTNYSVNAAGVTKGKKRYVVLDPDAGANPDCKIRVGGGRWLAIASGHLTVTTHTPQASLWQTNANGTETELCNIDLPAGGGPFSLSEIVDVPEGSYADLEFKVSNENGTNNITVENGSRFRVEALDERGFRAAAN